MDDPGGDDEDSIASLLYEEFLQSNDDKVAIPRCTRRSRRTKWRNRFTLSILFLVSFSYGLGYSIFAPFFPQEAREKNMSPEGIGLVFGAYELVIFFTSPLFGYLAPKLGLRWMILNGMLLSGCSTLLFGILQWCPANWTFSVLAVAMRIVEGIGASLYLTASFAAACIIFPDDVPLIYGMLESANAIGIATGPAIGGGLYELGGFHLPFIVNGCIILVAGFVSMLVIPYKKVKNENLTNPLPFFQDARACSILLAFAVTAISISFFDPTLAPHLNDVGTASTLEISFVFFIGGLAQAVFTPIWSKLLNYFGRPSNFAVLGILLQAMTIWLIGSSGLFVRVPSSFLTVFVGFVLTNAIFNTVTLAVPVILEETCASIGFDTSAMSTQSLIAGIYNSCWFFGSAVGPLISGPMMTNLGFKHSTFVLGSVMLVSMSIVLVSILVRRCRSSSKAVSPPLTPRLFSDTPTSSDTLSAINYYGSFDENL